MREKILKFKILQIQKTESKKFSEIFVWFVEYFKKYFEKQALIYIASLDNLEVLEKDSFDLEDLKKLLEDVYFLGLEEEKQKLEHHLETYWYIAPEIFLDNKEAIKYAEKHSAELIKQIDETTKNEMKDLITESLKNSLSINRIAEKIKDKFDKYSVYRASLIAQMETAIAYSQATRRQNDIFTKKLWIVGWKRAVTQKDSRVRQSHLENEAEGWIPKNQVFSSGDDNAPFGFFCRCRVDYSLVNPESGLLESKEYDFWWGYTDEQIDNFEHSFSVIENYNFKISKKEKKFIKYKKITNQELLTLKMYSHELFTSFNGFFLWWAKDENFDASIKFMFWWLNKLDNFYWVSYRWHKSYKKSELEEILSLEVWDVYQSKSFLSTSKSKNVALDFTDENNIIFKIISNKWKDFEKVSDKKYEKEVLFLPKTLFKVNKIEKDWRFTIIEFIDLR